MLGHACKNLSRDLGQPEHAVTHGEVLPATHFETSQTGAREVKISSAHSTRTGIASQILARLEAPTGEGYTQLHQGRMFTDDLADNACSVNPKTTTANSRDPIWRPARTSTRGAIATVHHLGTFWALAIPSCVLDFRQVARWRSTSWFSPHQSWPGCASEGAIRDHGPAA